MDRSVVSIGDTHLAVECRGNGRTLLLVHGGGEDASMLAGLAESLAGAGFQAVTYDRRGTGLSGRENWPGQGAGQHADDAADLLDVLGVAPAIVVGVSSGGVIALDLAARHRSLVSQVVAWEPPAAGVVPGGDEMAAELMAPVLAHLGRHPGDFVGAQAILLSAILGFSVAVDDPAFAATRANAEAMVRDEPTITLARFGPDSVRDVDLTILLGRDPLELIASAAARIAQWTGRSPRSVDADHEVYLTDPSVLARALTGVLASG